MTGLDGYRAWLVGDREALEATVTAYNKKLVGYIGSMSGDYAGAEDIASEAFLRLLVKKPRFDCEEQLSSWLYKTARNLLFNVLKRHKTDPLEELSDISDDEELLEGLCKSERDLQLHEAMKKLKSEYREILYLLYFADKNYAEICIIMKKNEMQVKNLARRARQSLKEKLERIGFTYED